MSLLNGALTVRRFRVVGADPEGWREQYRARLNENAFHEGPIEPGKEEREGWVQVHNLLDTSFDDFDRWLYNDVVLLALRVDKKVLPARLFKATLAKRVEAWCVENNTTRAPKAVREELRERLEEEWLARALPRVTVAELAIHLTHRYAVIDSLSEGVAERIRKRVFRTFGFTLVPFSPLDAIADTALRERLVQLAPAAVGDASSEGMVIA
jgi:DNA recombination-dependent growth factor C